MTLSLSFLSHQRLRVVIHHEGKSGQELMQKPRRNTAYCLVFRGLLAYPVPTCPGVAPFAMPWGLPHQSLIKKLFHRLAHRQSDSDGGIFLLKAALPRCRYPDKLTTVARTVVLLLTTCLCLSQVVGGLDIHKKMVVDV